LVTYRVVGEMVNTYVTKTKHFGWLFFMV